MFCQKSLSFRALFSQANSLARYSRVAILFPFENRQTLAQKSSGYATLAETEKHQLSKRALQYEYVLVTVKGFDPAVLDHYSQFIHSSGTIFDLHVTKRFNLPTESVNQTVASAPDNFKKAKTVYEFKKHGRMIQIKTIPVEKADIWLQFVQSNIPEGVSLYIEQKKWQDFVSPPDPRLEEQRQLAYLKRKGIFNPAALDVSTTK